jgi:hypothetical protein
MARQFVHLMGHTGNYTREEAIAAIDSERTLPDVLRFDPSRPAKYPNGRSFTDDVIDYRIAFLTKISVRPPALSPTPTRSKSSPISALRIRRNHNNGRPLTFQQYDTAGRLNGVRGFGPARTISAAAVAWARLCFALSRPRRTGRSIMTDQVQRRMRELERATPRSSSIATPARLGYRSTMTAATSMETAAAMEAFAQFTAVDATAEAAAKCMR